MTKGKSKRTDGLLKGTVIYAIGSVGSKVIMSLMLPLYAHFLTKEDFGYYDLSMAVMFLFVSFLTVDLKDGIFRFLFNSTNQPHQASVISSSFLVVLVNGILFSSLAIFINWIFPIKYFYLLLITLLSFSVYDVQMQALRGIGQVKLFVVANLLSALSLCIVTLIGLKYFHWGIAAFLGGNIISRFFVFAFLEWKTGFFARYFSFKSASKAKIIQILSYTGPLIPSVLCWWLIGSSGRVVISHFLGLQANGVFAISYRFSEVLYLLSVIFYQSWQETAIREYKAKDRDVFFTKVFNYYFFILSILAIIGTSITKIFFEAVMGREYIESLLYIFPLMVSVIFTAMSSFLDLGYQCSYQSSRSVLSIVSAMVFNLILNYIFVQFWGLYGVSVASMLTFLYLFIYRIIDTRRYFIIRITLLMPASLILLVVFGIVYYNFDSKWFLSLAVVVASSILFYLMINNFRRIFNKS